MSHAEFEDLIDGFRCRDAFHDREDGFVNKRHENAVRDKAGEVIHLNRSLFQLHGEVVNGGVGFLRGSKAADDLDKFHDWNGIEEVHADHFVGTASLGGKFGDGNRRCVRGEDHFGPAECVEVTEDLGFNVELFGGRLHDKVSGGDLIALGSGADMFERGFAIDHGKFALGDLTLQVLGDGVYASL